MTILELKDIIKKVSLAHNNVNTFDYGEQFEAVAGSGEYVFPAVFFEIPLFVDYLDNKTQKEIRFAMDFMDLKDFNNLEEDYDTMSRMEEIADAIFSRLRADYKNVLRFDTINGVTFRNFTDADVAGLRMDITITTSRGFCNTDYESQFEDC